MPDVKVITKQGWRVLAFDPGAVRMGFACLEKGEQPIWIGSGYWGLERKVTDSTKEPYQVYRLRLIDFWVENANLLFNRYEPDEVVSEIVPVVGGGNFVAATQSQLAGTAITTTQTVARQKGIPVKQVGATTIKAKIGRSKKATKVAVRNGVIELLPRLADRKKEWTKVFEEPDAIATGLTHLGYSVKR